MSEKQSWSERSAAADAARAELQWGMHYFPDERPSPEALAAEARARGDMWFQVDLIVSSYQGNVSRSSAGSTYTRVWRPEPYDHVGAVERQGWELHSVSTAFVERGASTSQLGGTETSTHGDFVALYVFRRRP